MAIDPLLLNVKPISEITTVDNPTEGHLLFYDGSDELKKVDIVEFQSLIGGRNFALDTKNKTLNLTANGSIAYSVSQDFRPNARNKYVTLSAYFEGSYVYATGGHYGIDVNIVYSDGSSEWISLNREVGVTESTAGTIVGARYSKTYKLKDLEVTAVNNLEMFIRGMSSVSKFIVKDYKLEFGNRATDWTPAPEDLEAKISTEAKKIISLDGKTNFLGSTTIDGNVVATGTLLVGNETGANGGLTGVGGANDIFLWGGSTFANRANAEVWFKRNGHFRLKTATGLEMDSQTGNIVVRHTNGQVGIKIGLDGSNPIMQFFKNTGEKVYELGQNGIYYVSEIAESYTLWRLLNLNSNASTSDFSIFHSTIRSNMWQKMSNLVQFELRGNKDSYLYEAGQNQYSQSNEQYEGYKNTQSKYDNLADGWYAMEQLGDMTTDGVNETQKIVSLMRLQGGKVVQSGATSVETNGYTFNQF